MLVKSRTTEFIGDFECDVIIDLQDMPNIIEVFYNDENITEMLTQDYLDKLFDMWRKEVELTEAQDYVLSQDKTLEYLQEYLEELYREQN